MAGRGMFGRLSCVSGRKNRQKEENHVNLIQELKGEVKAIQETERASVDGDSLVRTRLGWKR